MKHKVILYTKDGDIGAVFYSVKRKGDKLIIDTKALDAMRLKMVLDVKESFNMLRLAFNWGVISFILLLPYYCLRRCFSKTTSES